MPSITEVDNIKSLDDSGQTSILTKTGTGAGGDKVFTLDNVTLGSSVAGVGKVLQVVQTVKTDTFSSTAGSGTFADITGMTAAINPASTANKILVQCSVTCGSQTYAVYFKIQHNGSGSYADMSGSTGGAAGSRIPVTFGGPAGTADDAELSTNSITFLDSPSKDSSFTYKVVGAARYQPAAVPWTVNAPYTDTDATYTGRAISTLTLMEIKG